MSAKKFFISRIIFFMTWIFFSTASADVQFGDVGAEVEEVQRYLIAKNFLQGEADGIFGAETEQALKNFQSAVGLNADGICGKETFWLLMTEKSGSSSDLRLGDSGEKVIELQNTLIRLEYLSGAADGIFGVATEQALKNFQSANGISADGICGAKTFEILETYAEVQNFSKPMRTDATNNLTQPSGILKFGDQSYAVKEMQDMLIGWG